MEQWKDIPEYEGRYQVSDLGRVRSLDRDVRTVSRFGAETTRRARGKVLAPQKHSAGYAQVTLSGKLFLVHALVLLAFVGPCPGGLECAHNDGDKWNNVPGNLRYATPKANANDRRLHGTSGSGESNAGAKLTAAQVAEIRATPPGEKQKDIGRRYGVGQMQVSRILRDERWAA